MFKVDTWMQIFTQSVEDIKSQLRAEETTS